MSYSFNVTGKTRKAVMQEVTKQLAQAVSNQPEHASDVRQAADAVEAQLGVLEDLQDGQQYAVSVSGWITWTGNVSDNSVIAANLTVAVSIQ